MPAAQPDAAGRAARSAANALVAERFRRIADLLEIEGANPFRVRAYRHAATTVRLTSGLQADLLVVPAESYGAALIHFTGSKTHNISLRRRAKARGWKLNELGLYQAGRRFAGWTEAEIYAALGLPEIPPDRREGPVQP